MKSKSTQYEEEEEEDFLRAQRHLIIFIDTEAYPCYVNHNLPFWPSYYESETINRVVIHKLLLLIQGYSLWLCHDNKKDKDVHVKCPR